MAASTVWTIQLKVMTASAAPRLFANLRDNAKAAGKEVGTVQKGITAFGTAAKEAAPQVQALTKSTRTLARAMGLLPDIFTKAGTGIGAVNRGFQGASRAAGTFARTMRVVARASVGDLGGVTQSLRAVRNEANGATAAVRTMDRALQRRNTRNVAMSDAGALGVAVAAGGVAAGAAGALSAGTRGAADLQTALVGIQNATGADPDQMGAIRSKAYELSALTAQSVTDSAHVLAVMARSGINDPNKLLQIAKPAALFADVQYLSRGTDFAQSAQNAIMLAHLFHQYDPKGATNMFDMMTRLSELMPDNLNRAVTQMGYFVPGLKALGVKDDQSIALMGLLDRVGYGRGKGGTGIAALVNNALGPLQLTTHAQVGKNALLQQIGVLDGGGNSLFYDKKSQSFDMMGFLHQLATFASQHDRADVVKMFRGAFGAQGGRIADMATDSNFITQMNSIIKFMHRDDLSMVHQQKRYMNTLNGQAQLFKTNFQSLLTEVMWPWLDRMRETFGFLAEKTHDIQAFLHKHPTVGRAVAVGAGATALVGGTAAAVLGASLLTGITGVSLGAALGELAAAAIQAALVMTGPVGLTIAIVGLGAVVAAHALKYAPVNAKLAQMLSALSQSNSGLGDLARGIRHVLELLHILPHSDGLTPQQKAKALDQMRKHGPYKIGPLNPSPVPLVNGPMIPHPIWQEFGPRHPVDLSRPHTSGRVRTRARAHHGEVATSHQLHITIASQVPNDPHVIRKLADAILDHASHNVDVDVRAGGSTPQMVGHSHYSIEQGRTA